MNAAAGRGVPQARRGRLLRAREPRLVEARRRVVGRRRRRRGDDRRAEPGGEPSRAHGAEGYGALARHPGRIVTRDRILREVWGPAGEAEEGSLRVFVNSLRKKIEADPAKPELITTEPGVGYRLETLPLEGGSS